MLTIGVTLHDNDMMNIHLPCNKTCYMVLEAGSQRKIFISSFLQLIIQVTILWRRKMKGESISKMEVYRKMRSIREVGRWRKKVRKAGKEERSGRTKVEKEDQYKLIVKFGSPISMERWCLTAKM